MTAHAIEQDEDRQSGIAQTRRCPADDLLQPLSNHFPPYARDMLVKAARTDAHIRYGCSSERIDRINRALQQIKADYPRLLRVGA